ncbi:metabotropic glutamate receptor-like isoform X2 [Mercenaria mercenaria]|uniref:metabotropic glutamate receptor-like isoform X2 n=1 Tax=Mercenaria mercenaria TaxID=6596 RepID=UPI00234F50FD|nr:metabotropic glutamate receptor-like isoform X2 [Mercenaria mercenaria]
MALLKFLLASALVVMLQAQEECPADGCTSSDVALLEADNMQAANHYYIGAMLNVHEQGEDAYTCGKTSLRGLVNAEAFFWAIKEYSQRAGLTNNIDPVSVGGFLMDSCGRVAKSIEDIYSFQTCRRQYTNVSPRNTVAIVGASTSDQSMAVAELLNSMEVTQVSSSSTSPYLSNTNMYEYFLRTVPSDVVQTVVMARLMLYKSIQYVQVLYQDNAYGMGLLLAFKEALEGTGVCITAQSQFDMNARGADYIKTMLKGPKDTRFVVILGTNMAARFVLETVDGENDLKNQFTFVGTSSWGTDVNVIRGIDSAENAITFTFNTGSYMNKDDVINFYNKMFMLKPDTGSNSGDANVNLYNPWFTKFWEEAFECSFAAATCDLADQKLEDKIDRSDPYVPFTLMAVDAIIRGVKEAAQTKCGNIHVCSNLLNPDKSRGTDLFNFIKNTTSGNGQRFFDAKGDAASVYDNFRVYQVRDGAYFNVLDYTASQTGNYGFDSVGKPAMVTGPSSCPSRPCLECGEVQSTTQAPETTTTTPDQKQTLPPLSSSDLLSKMIEEYFKDDQEFTGVWREQMRESKDSSTRFENGFDWIIAIGVCAGLGIVCVLVFEIYILYKLMGTKIGKQWRTMWLGQLLLFGLFCSYLTLFAYLFTPTKETCGITRFGVGVSYAMCFAVLLVKLMVLLTSKTSADTLLPGDVDSPNYLRGIYQFLMFLFVVGVQVVIAVQWLIQVPPDAIQVKSNTGDMVWICNHYTWSLNNSWDDMTTFVRTDFENHLLSLTYIMFLILLTTIIAMKAHGIITNHRESVFIGIAAGFSIPVWVAWGLVGGLNKDHKYAEEFGDAAIAFGLFITATLVLFSMFLPKVRQLVNMGVEGIYLEDDRDTYYAGSVVMAPPSYKSRPSSVVYVNSNGYNDPVVLGDQNAVHLRHPGSNYSAPVYVKKPESIHGGSGKVLRVTGDLTGKHPRESKKSASEAGYHYAGSGYGTYRKPRSESGGTMRRSASATEIGAL